MPVSHARVTAVTSTDDPVPGMLEVLAQVPDPRRKRGRRRLEPVPEVLLHPSVIERFAR